MTTDTSAASAAAAAAAPAPTGTAATAQRILRVGPVNPQVARTLDEEFDALVLPSDPAERAAFLAEQAGGIRIAVCSGRVGVDTELMRSLPDLEAIINFGVGYDATDVAQAAERGIPLSNTPDVLNDCVADTALALYLDTLRQVSAADRFVRAGRWAAGEGFPLTARASGRTVGILGLGRIGTAIAQRLGAFGCRIHYHNRSERPESGYTYHRTVRELAEAVDVLVVAASGGPDSVGIVGAAELAALGPQGHLVNIARGTVVDEDALVAALTEGTIAGAGLDVYEREPQVPEALFGLENVVLLPHVGSGTRETRADMAELVLSNLRRYLADGTLLTPIS
ncbi:2-hydroxyacid dehydrogenase [Citricoccus sp. I39-566]|uniref:2-hydroxyacid dehydrogenase n=1 Tax=Citricoccus sp. I39-566 TaxID=3073268 RepID=UPI00286B6FC4|nr:2-hydroxyacid dehydrogenase [Citricoccus sp. I39-566]WMY77933.1 2-hydroxyacid dehydrogenase [Citricoccus sp. I39-566]